MRWERDPKTLHSTVQYSRRKKAFLECCRAVLSEGQWPKEWRLVCPFRLCNIFSSHLKMVKYDPTCLLLSAPTPDRSPSANRSLSGAHICLTGDCPDACIHAGTEEKRREERRRPDYLAYLLLLPSLPHLQIILFVLQRASFRTAHGGGNMAFTKYK